MGIKLIKTQQYLKEHPVLTTADAERLGISRHELKLWADEGQIHRIQRGVYSGQEPEGSPDQIMASIKKPCAIGGITALIHYGYTNVIGHKTWVLVPKGHPVINRPGIETMRQLPKVFKIGLVTLESPWGPYQMVDREKAVLDAYRGRFLDIEEQYRVLKRYIKDPEHKNNNLLKYANHMKVNKGFHDLFTFQVAQS